MNTRLERFALALGFVENARLMLLGQLIESAIPQPGIIHVGPTAEDIVQDMLHKASATLREGSG